jgi:catechol 2,3-dioxygenase-like lactoylglutathione lyase family enzyme
MFSGAHVMIFSRDAEADRAFFRDSLELPAVDAGGGWLIFALPPAEVGFHSTAPGEAPAAPELYLMCEDVHALTARLNGRGIATDAVTDAGWGLTTRITLPSGARLGIYEPRHERPAHR